MFILYLREWRHDPFINWTWEWSLTAANISETSFMMLHDSMIE